MEPLNAIRPREQANAVCASALVLKRARWIGCFFKDVKKLSIGALCAFKGSHSPFDLLARTRLNSLIAATKGSCLCCSDTAGVREVRGEKSRSLVEYLVIYMSS